MKIGILGSGRVGQTFASKLVERGHEVMLGSRNPTKLVDWQVKTGNKGYIGTLSEAAAHGEILFNITPGEVALDVLAQAGEGNLNGKILIDMSNAMDFSHGMPPSLFVSNTDSVAEQIQRAYPAVKVVKTLNTVAVGVIVNPQQLAGGDHDLFISGNDADAKAQVTQLIASWFGWKRVIDLGDISSARGPEMYMILWGRLMGTYRTDVFNVKVVH